jgi:uncharacterized Zn-finger protein
MSKPIEDEGEVRCPRCGERCDADIEPISCPYCGWEASDDDTEEE